MHVVVNPTGTTKYRQGKKQILDFKRKLKHVCTQFYEHITPPPHLTEYNEIPDNIKPQNYLLQNIPLNIRKAIARIRLQSNRLELVRGRFARPKIPKELRFCKTCHQYIDNEEHLITKCELLDNLREETFKLINDIRPEFTTFSNNEKTHAFLHPLHFNDALNFGRFFIQASRIRNL